MNQEHLRHALQKFAAGNSIDFPRDRPSIASQMLQGVREEGWALGAMPDHLYWSGIPHEIASLSAIIGEKPIQLLAERGLEKTPSQQQQATPLVFADWERLKQSRC